MDGKGGKLELIATRSFAPYDEMYQVVDFLNKTLKNRGLIFGLTKSPDGRMAITVYET